MSVLANKKILLGICGGIAAYKCADLVRKLVQYGAEVRVVMTKSAMQFVTPITLQALSGREVRCDLFDINAEQAMGHIELARWADLILIAPATVNFLAKMAHGLGDDLLSTLCLVTENPVFVCPAMNRSMFLHPANQANLQLLQQRFVHVIGPAFGEQACGEIGYGRMSEVEVIVEELSANFAAKTMVGQHILITAGPTREPIDPIRYISNYSSGKMGYALAKAALLAGAKVTLVTGPTELNPPVGAELHRVTSALEMYEVVMRELKQNMILISTAAIADYTVINPALDKLKKHDVGDVFNLTLTTTPDLLSAVAQTGLLRFVVGFAAETNNVIDYARQKLNSKGLDMIIANDVSDGKVFASDDNQVCILTKKDQISLSLANKNIISQQIIAIIAANLQNSAFEL